MEVYDFLMGSNTSFGMCRDTEIEIMNSNFCIMIVMMHLEVSWPIEEIYDFWVGTRCNVASSTKYL